MIEADICILGAGPGGVATALQLAKLDIPCILVDKATFPRDKICGDAISGKVIHAFNKIDEQIFKDFNQEKHIKTNCWGVKFGFDEAEIEMLYKEGLTVGDLANHRVEGYVSKREDFDNFLVDYVRREENIDFREGLHLTEITKVPEGFTLKNKEGTIEISTKLIIAADGAQSKFARQFGNMHKEDRHYAGAVRAYYKNVKGDTPFHHLELHYLKEFHPGYLWIFPLPNGHANVGVGMRTDKLRQTGFNLNKELVRILQEHPRYKDRFKDAELIGKIRGFGLPMGSKKRTISGPHYMLVGDAASLIDPLTGEGIGNAAISGRFAAFQAEQCLLHQDFSASFMKKYDTKVYDRLWKELQISTRLQGLLRFPWLVNIGTKMIQKNKRFIELLSAMFKDVDLRKKLRNPLFYFRLLTNR